MKRILTAVLALCLTIPLAACGSSSSGGSSGPWVSLGGNTASASSAGNTAATPIPTLTPIQLPTITPIKDILTEHTVFKTGEDSLYTEYVIYFYGHDTHKLKQMSDQVLYSKDSGVTAEQLETLDVSDVFPGFDSFSFTERIVEDRGDYYRVDFRFKDLDQMANVRALTDNGILLFDDTSDLEQYEGVSVDSLMENTKDKGGEEVSLVDYANIDLNYSLVE